MIVGFTITDFRGYERAAVEFIRKVCILEHPSVAQNIVDAGVGVNIFTSAVTLPELNAQPFKATPIETQDGKHLLVSAVNFNLEILHNGKVIRLAPTEYIYVDTQDISQFDSYIREGLLKVIPEMTQSGEWIVGEGIWNDDGIWIDSERWRD